MKRISLGVLDEHPEFLVRVAERAAVVANLVRPAQRGRHDIAGYRKRAIEGLRSWHGRRLMREDVESAGDGRHEHAGPRGGHSPVVENPTALAGTPAVPAKEVAGLEIAVDGQLHRRVGRYASVVIADGDLDEADSRGIRGVAVLGAESYRTGRLVRLRNRQDGIVGRRRNGLSHSQGACGGDREGRAHRIGRIVPVDHQRVNIHQAQIEESAREAGRTVLVDQRGDVEAVEDRRGIAHGYRGRGGHIQSYVVQRHVEIAAAHLLLKTEPNPLTCQRLQEGVEIEGVLVRADLLRRVAGIGRVELRKRGRARRIQHQHAPLVIGVLEGHVVVADSVRPAQGRRGQAVRHGDQLGEALQRRATSALIGDDIEQACDGRQQTSRSRRIGPPVVNQPLRRGRILLSPAVKSPRLKPAVDDQLHRVRGAQAAIIVADRHRRVTDVRRRAIAGRQPVIAVDVIHYETHGTGGLIKRRDPQRRTIGRRSEGGIRAQGVGRRKRKRRQARAVRVVPVDHHRMSIPPPWVHESAAQDGRTRFLHRRGKEQAVYDGSDVCNRDGRARRASAADRIADRKGNSAHLGRRVIAADRAVISIPMTKPEAHGSGRPIDGRDGQADTVGRGAVSLANAQSTGWPENKRRSGRRVGIVPIDDQGMSLIQPRIAKRAGKHGPLALRTLRCHRQAHDGRSYIARCDHGRHIDGRLAGRHGQRFQAYDVVVQRGRNRQEPSILQGLQSQPATVVSLAAYGRRCLSLFASKRSQTRMESQFLRE